MASVYVHDFAGHPFQAELSRRLADLGHVVRHTYAAEYTSGKGDFRSAAGVTFAPVTVGRPLHKYSVRRRTDYEVRFARRLWRDLKGADPDVVVLCNTPLVVLSAVTRYLKLRRIPWVLWHQDVYSAAMSAEVRRRLPRSLARPVSMAIRRSERASCLRAASIVAIGPGFLPYYERWGIPSARVSVIPNWAPLDEITPAPRDNEWARAKGLDLAALRLVYAGTLGRKHRPLLLLELHEALARRGIDATLVVVSEGVGAEEIRENAGAGVTVLPFQDASQLPLVLASGDVLVALLEADAAEFSIPSKVLSYLAAGRPVVGMMPAGNPAAHDIQTVGGVVVPPSHEGADAAAAWVASTSQDERATIGMAARHYAEQHFDVDKKAAEFNELIETMLPDARARMRVTAE
jgi:colanic acid biosynthesis glycosyl transferase WcaI